MLSRRHFLLGGTLIAGASWYAYQRGLRYPRLSFEPRDIANSLTTPEAVFDLHQLIVTPSNSGSKLTGIELRAIAPEPELTLKAQRGKISIGVNNISAAAKLSVQGKGIKLVSEEVLGIYRHLEIDNGAEQTLHLKWHLPDTEGVDFAVIGDTGGGDELTWSIQRAHQINAQFLLHLGDFNYSAGEYERAINEFKSAPLPCYISIGNHDFNDSGLVYHKFLQNLGPLNSRFTIAGTRFVNLDTAADYFPAHAGLRGALFQELLAEPFDGEHVYYTHSPLLDPRPMDDHEVGGINEVNWLVNTIKAVGNGPFLTGHVHHSAELNFEGIHQFSIGEGLGYEDLVLEKNVAKMMLARVQAGLPMSYQWVDLDMPYLMHTSPTHAWKLKRDGLQSQLQKHTQLMANKQVF